MFTLRRESTIGTKTYRAGTVFVRQPGKTEIARPDGIRALEDRYAAPGRLAEAHAREMLEIEKKHATRPKRSSVAAGGEPEMARLAAAVMFKTQAVMDTQGLTTVGSTKMVTSGYFRCTEQLEVLQSLIAGMNMSGLQAVSDLAGDGQATQPSLRLREPGSRLRPPSRSRSLNSGSGWYSCRGSMAGV